MQSNIVPPAAKGVSVSTSQPAVSPTAIRVEELQKMVAQMTLQLREVGREINAIQKDHEKERRAWERQMQKMKQKNAAKKGGGQSGGITKPGYISKELCSFIGVKENTRMARTEVIKYIDSYIKEHSLQDTNNKKRIVPDAKLGRLLQSDSIAEDITYFNLQSFMKPHLSDPRKQLLSSATA